MAIAGQVGGLWRPASEAEGAAFEADWCAHCLNRYGDGDWEDEFGNDVRGQCIASISVHWISPEPELCMRDGMHWCKAFRQDPEVPARCLFTKEMDV